MFETKLHPRLAALEGTILNGRYALVDVVGQGGMGVVFAARHLTLQRKVAVKVLHPKFSLDPQIGGRFDREAKIASLLDHMNCCRVIDYGTTDNECKYMVMPWLDGTGFSDLLNGPMHPARAIRYMAQLLRGLKHAHDLGVVHRDLKPENLILTRDGEGQELLKITDFGIAKIVRGRGARDHVTAVGMVCGTPEYMSPEQALGRKLDGRSDLYCAGLIFYEMLAGRPAFSHRNPVELMRMQVYKDPTPLPDTVPPVLGALIRDLMVKDPNERIFDAKGALQRLSVPEIQEIVRPPKRAGLWGRLRAAVGLDEAAEDAMVASARI